MLFWVAFPLQPLLLSQCLSVNEGSILFLPRSSLVDPHPTRSLPCFIMYDSPPMFRRKHGSPNLMCLRLLSQTSRPRNTHSRPPSLHPLFFPVSLCHLLSRRPLRDLSWQTSLAVCSCALGFMLVNISNETRGHDYLYVFHSTHQRGNSLPQAQCSTRSFRAPPSPAACLQ